jgi:hypothetical protein
MASRIIGIVFQTILIVAIANAAPSGLAAQQLAAPKDINYLATMSEQNRPYYESYVLGVVRFSGQGRVVSTDEDFGSIELFVDMGENNGIVMCKGGREDFRDLHPGNIVTVTGSVGGAMTAPSIHVSNQRAAEININPKAIWAERDTLLMLAGTCRATKMSEP